MADSPTRTPPSAWATPTTCARRSTPTSSEVRFTDGADLARPRRRRCATRCSRRASASGPVLALATALAVGREPAEVLPLAAALELIHTYSLIHDDLPAMDDDDLRRGRPTCHVAYGEDVAILAGDALYAEALRHIVAHQRGEPAAIAAARSAASRARPASTAWSAASTSTSPSWRPPGPTGLRRLHALKTGRLIAACVAVRARAAATPAKLRQCCSVSSPRSLECSFRSLTTSST